MVQSGLPEDWWDCALECCCHLRNVHDKMADGKTAYENIVGVTLIPFAAKSSHKPFSSNDEARLHQFVKTIPPRIFMECVVHIHTQLKRADNNPTTTTGV